MALERSFIEALHRHGLRMTRSRRIVYQVLAGEARPLAALELAAIAADTSSPLDTVTIYRTLDTFERCDLVMRIDKMRVGWRYALLSNPHGHTITCSSCGNVVNINACAMDRMEREVEQATGYGRIRHTLQFYGTCPGCLNQPARSTFSQ